ncbi:MAG: signal transduction protein [Okeania sp. SIO2B3]|nr:signal transduction protein [Okeania sp. SIO2B3]
MGDRSNESSSPLSKGGQGGSKTQCATILGLDPNTDWLPILIRIRDLARHPDKSILEYARIFAEKTMAVKTLPIGFFEHWLEDGRALILLDGLDEVAEEGKRYDVVRRIENFLGQFDRNRAIITSRPAGYRRDFFRTEEFPHYQMQSFDDEKISAFINNWYDSRFQDKAEAERRKESLRKALDDNDRIKLLARNPLLLTIIALIHRYQAVLPKKRFELYDAAVKTLLTSWDANKEISNHGVFKYLDLDDLRRLMELLAYWVHTQGNVGDNQGGTLIDRDELTEQLSREIKQLKQVQLYQAKEEAERFVKLIRERTGLLNEQGQDCYGFVHKTFQEYLCAEEINYQLENELDFGIILNAIREHLHDAHWREVLLLLIAQQKPKNVAKAIRAVLNNGSEYEEWLHRDLFFAGNCLAEDPKGLRSVDGELVQEILERLVELEVSSKELVGWKVRGQVYQIFCSLYETDFEAEVLEMLKKRADLIDEKRLLKYRAEFGENDKVIQTLIAKLKEESSSIRRKAVEALGDLGNTSEAVVNPLISLLQGKDSDLSWEATLALGYLASTSKKVVTILLKLLEDENSHVCGMAAFALGLSGSNISGAVVTTLPTLIQDRVISTILPLLEDENSHVRWRAAFALGYLGNRSETVASSLLKLLQDSDFNVCGWAAYALGNLGNNSKIIISAMLELLQGNDSRVRSEAAYALGNLGNSSETVINALLPLLQDKDYTVREKVAKTLSILGNKSETIVNALLPSLHNEDSYVRLMAAEALSKLGNYSEIVVSTLLDLLEDETRPSVRKNAADALGKLGKKSNNILPTIIEWIQQHQDSEYVGRGIDVLWDLVVGKEN